MSTSYTNGYIADKKGRSLAMCIQDAFLSSHDKAARTHGAEEAVQELMVTPRHDRAIPGFIDELMPVLTRGMAVEHGLCDMESGYGMHQLYVHADVGGNITYDSTNQRLIAWNGHAESFGAAVIGPLGLRELGEKLLALAAELEGVKQ